MNFGEESMANKLLVITRSDLSGISVYLPEKCVKWFTWFPLVIFLVKFSTSSAAFHIGFNESTGFSYKVRKKSFRYHFFSKALPDLIAW